MRFGVGILTLSVGAALLECAVLTLVVSCVDTSYCTTNHLPFVFNAYYRTTEDEGCAMQDDADAPDAALGGQCQCREYWSRRGHAADVVQRFSSYES